MLALVLSLLLAPDARAATLVVETTVAAEVRHNGLRVAQTFGPGRVMVPDLPDGVAIIDVYRDGKRTPMKLDLAAEGETRLLIGADTIDTAQADGTAAEATPEIPVDGPPPRVELKAQDDQRFTVVWDGEILGVLAAETPMQLPDTTPGEHSLELRSQDRTVIWVRGTLQLQPGDALTIRAHEGRMIEVFGRPEAWRPNL